MTYENVIVTVEAGVGQILLNRPEQRNAVNHALLDELNGALIALDADEDVRAIVVSGAGRVFCAGLDVSDPDIRVNRDITERTEVRAWELDTPIIGALNGAAIGVGLTLPLQWDIRIAAEEAPLSFAFSRLGLIPEAGSHWFLPRLIGSSRAAELLLTGRRFTGAEAAEMGLVSRAVPAGEVLAVATEIARDIAANVSPLSATVVKRLLREFAGLDDPRPAVARENALLGWVAAQPDVREGIMAMKERRAPAWKSSKHTPIPDS
jgi:enoyl-CoA hydratase/carnithine racemase